MSKPTKKSSTGKSPELRAIGEALRAARERSKMTRPQLASKLSLDEETIKKMEAGERVAQWRRVAQVANAVNSTPNELLGFPAASADLISDALKPILFHFDIPTEVSDNIADYLVEAIQLAQSAPEDGPDELRYKMAGRLAVSRSRDQTQPE